MSSHLVSLKQLIAGLCVLVSTQAVAAGDVGAGPESAVVATVAAASTPAALVSVRYPLLKPIDQGGTVPGGVQVESFDIDNDDDSMVTLSGISRTAEDIGVLAVQLKESGWLSKVDITTVTRRGPSRAYPWRFSMQALVSMENSEQLGAR